jgi:uncharacterized protein DUF4154
VKTNLRLIAALVMLVVGLAVMPAVVCGQALPTSDVAVKAAFLFNFAKFTDWSSLAPTAPLTLCVVDDSRLAYSLVELVRGQRVDGHPLVVTAIGADASMRSCNVLFISSSDVPHAAMQLSILKTLPILSVSDAQRFVESTGVIELFVESGRMRFAINIDAANRAGLHLSSRLLGLARIVRDDHVQ